MRIDSRPIEEDAEERQPLDRYGVAALMLQHWWMLVVLSLLFIVLLWWV